jgi:His-Xaa-Ser system radical SAM maturase HxsB
VAIDSQPQVPQEPVQSPQTLFQQLDRYKGRAGATYSLLPFRFLALDATRFLLTNFTGELLVLPKEVVRLFVHHRLPIHSDIYYRLKSRHFLIDGDSTVPVDLLAAKYRTKQAALSQFTSLFMLVTTLRCNQSCVYCQVSGRSENEHRFDMTEPVADAAVDFMFRSPSSLIKVEFQGGEPLLHFDLVKHIVRSVEQRNASAHRDIEFVIATNLSRLTEEVIHFCRDHNVYFSTSLDGPCDLHNRNRPSFGHGSYKDVVSGIRRVQDTLGPQRISALMTSTRASLQRPREIVDEYVHQGFSSIVLRTLHPYGRAAVLGTGIGYSIDEWLQFYREALRYILELNSQGIVLREATAVLLLRKILTPWATRYVDLQSPAGIGIAGIVINYDGNVYCSDEARMLAEMGDQKFLMGDILSDQYKGIMLSEALLSPLEETLTECMPQCSDCGIQPYCGSDPVRHYRSQGDMVGFKPASDFCKMHLGLVKHLVRLLEDEPAAAKILRTWI